MFRLHLGQGRLMADVLAAADARRWAADGTARKIREAALLTQAEVAEQVGVTPAAVAAWEASDSRLHLRRSTTLTRAAGGLDSLSVGLGSSPTRPTEPVYCLG
jgi:DNA-binding XRE family transcriptional regulator